MDSNSHTSGSLNPDGEHYLESNLSSSLGSDNSDIHDDSADESDASRSLDSYDFNFHYHSLDDHPDSLYPPPTLIDFATGELRPPFLPTRLSPLIFDCQWLGGHHDGYPLATTLDEYVRLRLIGSTLGTLEYAALVQSTFSFGLLEAVLRMKIPESFLLSQAADGTITLSTANLPILCRDVYHRVRVRHHPDKCRSWLKDAAVTLSPAEKLLESYLSSGSANPFLDANLPQEAFEDIRRTLCTIGFSLFLVLGESPSECNPNQTIPPVGLHRFPDRKPAKDQLRAQGWCPVTIAALGMYGFVLPEYATSFRPFLRNAGEHSRCTESVCAVNSIDPKTYFQRHFPEECNCAPVIPPFHRVESLLSDNRIPVVAVSDEELTVRAADVVPYVAISHVWVDGLGSTTEEGLPACQVSRIASMASSLVPGCAFWIDGLCVPKRKDLRKQAIQLMAKTYTDAAAVLVIDAGIRTFSKDAPLEEKLFRIFTSGWMQRLWTYQEAMLAKKVWFAFRDGLVNLEDLMLSHEERSVDPLLFWLTYVLWNMKLYISGDTSKKDSFPIRAVMDAVRWRTTSKLEDETLAIAGLLHIDVRELLNASSPNERMKSLLLQKRTVSPNIIFDTAPKLSSTPGFSWAPRSFMTGPHPGAWSGQESAICTPAGLLAEYASLIFSLAVELDEEGRYVIRDSTRPACSFLLQPVVLARDKRREFCNAILIRGDISLAIGGYWNCVGVQMIDEEEGTVGEKEQVCRYREARFNLAVIDVFEASLRQNIGTSVIDAKWVPKMKVRVV